MSWEGIAQFSAACIVGTFSVVAFAAAHRVLALALAALAAGCLWLACYPGN